MKSKQSGIEEQKNRIILFFGTLSVILIISAQVAYTQVPGSRYASYAYQKTTAFNPTEFRNGKGLQVVMYSDITDSERTQSVPEFAMGPSSEQYQAARIITYDAIAKDAAKMSYALDPESEKAGNSIDPTTGEVTYVEGWSGNTTITATATNDNGRTFSSLHNVTVHPLPLASVSGVQTISCTGIAMVTGAKAENGSIRWTHNGKGSITAANTLNPVYNAVAADAGKTVQLTLTVRSYYEECGEKIAQATFDINVKADEKK